MVRTTQGVALGYLEPELKIAVWISDKQKVVLGISFFFSYSFHPLFFLLSFFQYYVVLISGFGKYYVDPSVLTINCWSFIPMW